MSFNNIPLELRQLNQWVVWRLEKREGAKPTKVPYSPWAGGGRAFTANSQKHGILARDTWGSFEQACGAPMTCTDPCDPTLEPWVTGYSGIGFVFSEEDEYAGIDLDDTHGDQEAYARQLKVYSEFNSYSELSPSGTGLHIIIKATLPHGRRRADIELYSKERYFTMTGNVQNNVPIEHRQELAELLFEQMGGAPQTFTYGQESEQKEPDEQIISKASEAVNGEKFKRLFSGDWQTLYSSQSEADFALVDIVAFYTQNSAQIARIFRQSALGQRDKAQRDDYVGYMVRKSFDRQLPPVDIEGLRIAIQKKMDEAIRSNGGAIEPGRTAAPPNDPALSLAAIQAGPQTVEGASHDDGARVNSFPPGLLGEIAQFILDASPRPVPEIALAGAIALMSGITGRAYNVSGTGLNQYIMLLARTGRGKDAIAYGISKLMAQVCVSVPSAADFKGPGELVSSAGLIRWLEKKPGCISVLGEIGLMMQQMASPNASSHLKGLERVMLQFYSKSGKSNVFDPTAYSDKEKNTATIISPSLTIIGESVPDRFYEVLDENMVMSGLVPRFMIFEYIGKREYLKEGTELVQPSFRLVQGVADLAAQCLSLSHNGNVFDVPQDDDARKMFRDFEHWTTDYINSKGVAFNVLEELWNRAHLKALKLAAVCSVGINPHNPVIDANCAKWAIELMIEQTNKLLAKFETGNIGAVGGSENKQLAHMIAIISDYITKPMSEQPKCGINEYMHGDGIFTASMLSRRLNCMAAFKNDKNGASNAIARTIKMLMDADEIREIPKSQMTATYGAGPRAFAVSNPARFINLGKD